MWINGICEFGPWHSQSSWNWGVILSAGCGKTLIWCVSIIWCFINSSCSRYDQFQHHWWYQSHCSSRNWVAFFYFDTNDKYKRNSRNLLSSLTLSLTAKSKSYLHMQKLYEKYDKLYHPTKEELLDLLMKLIQNFKQAYIVIDALDECDDYNHLIDVIHAIHGRKLSHFHPLVIEGVHYRRNISLHRLTSWGGYHILCWCCSCIALGNGVMQLKGCTC